MKNQSVKSAKFNHIVSVLTIVLTGVISTGRFAAADSSFILVTGATEAQLTSARALLEKAAYGASHASAIKDEDSCEFYKPPQKLRLFKRMPATDPCQTYSKTPGSSSSLPRSALVADTKSNVLFLCKDGATVADYDFSMGREGTNKRAEGDRKTPLGKYTLGNPIASDKFSAFIPIAYPTSEQKKLGYTGSDVGIHGPSRTFRCMGFFNVIVDWTQGCLAVSSDIFVKEVARFVETNNTETITIR